MNCLLANQERQGEGAGSGGQIHGKMRKFGLGNSILQFHSVTFFWNITVRKIKEHLSLKEIS
jgi:hypothetical protein